MKMKSRIKQFSSGEFDIDYVFVSGFGYKADFGKAKEN